MDLETVTADELRELSRNVVINYHNDLMDEPYEGAGYCTCWLCQEIAPQTLAAAITIERLEFEAVSQAHALGAAIESANLWTEIAERLEAKYEAILSELEKALYYIATQDAENAALRTRLDACCDALMADAEGR